MRLADDRPFHQGALRDSLTLICKVRTFWLIQLRGEMTSSFTAHNVILDDGTQTAPETGFTLNNSPHVTAVHRLAKVLFPDGIQGKRLVDLGCLEGGFATEFARLGLDSTGIEVRSSNFANCMHIKQNVDLPNLHFIQDDAWNIGKYGPFDIVFCVGLFYHIDRITDFLHLLFANCGRMLFLDTHFAPQNDESPSVSTYNLSSLTTHENIPGRWFPEHELETSSKALDDLKWASWENKASFWPTRPAILKMLQDAGFDLVFEGFHQFGNEIVEAMAPTGYYQQRTRSVFVGLKVA